ncbi:cytochrome P450 [Aspergillus eucalypticola CBS 122712]|uniref:Cytochrome P450 n=1 Tax=Aspergillus eucalypticola (strain CBS 122712 / IBT 29274) TaxID=1448314 RepID=A0A317V7M0_ASPEC|nr:cytochrome P450 [Aspergillus eucalypticola CBS 122712]PWY68832.1 cytochrome P450 [Aspergillus eucalypticola CBS 122712]
MFRTLLLFLVPKSLHDAQKKHKAFTTTKMLRRLAITEDRPDLINTLLKKKEDLGLGMDHLIANAEILIIGGSETTAFLLSGVTYFLLENPGAHQNLRDEVRSTFRSQDEINLISVNKLSYMLACLDEGLRMYPPIANASVGLSIPNSYHPERFMGSPQFTNDRCDVFQPFHVGPRNCLGRNLAYSEMRLILALIMFNFDMQKNLLMWQKRPLKVYLKPVPRNSP